MSHPIMPDPMDQQRVLALLGSAGLSSDPDRLSRVSGGTINETWRADDGDDAWYVRLGVPDHAAAEGPSWMTSRGLPREDRVFDLLAPMHELLPERVHRDFTRTLVDRDWVVHRAVRGQAWSDVKASLSSLQNDAIWRQLGEITHRIHSIVGSEFGAPDEGAGQSKWSELVRWDVTGFRVDAERFELDTDIFDRLIALVDHEADVLDQVTEPRLIHSDLGERHVYVSDVDSARPQITGLIDFEFARFADPWSESIPVLQRLGHVPEAEYAQFELTYGSEPTGHSFDVQMEIYVLTALGWFATDLARQGKPDALTDVLQLMIARLNDARA